MDPSQAKNLAEFLGVQNPRERESPRTPDPGILTPKRFCQAVLNSPEFRTYIVNGLVLGDIPPAIVIRLMDTGWGKPVDRLEVHETAAPLEQLSVEQLEDRALFLASLARKIRESEADDTGSVH